MLSGVLMAFVTVFNVELTDVPRRTEGPDRHDGDQSKQQGILNQAGAGVVPDGQAITDPTDDHCLPEHYLV